MKRWQRMLPAVLLGCSLLITNAFPLQAHSQEDGANRKTIYMFSSEFPPNMLAQYPTPPLQETKFWKLLDRDMSATEDLTLTENIEDADYQIELRCGGIVNCSKLIVDVKDANRALLTSFTLSRITSFYFGLGRPNLPVISKQLTQKLDTRLQQLAQGNYGFSN